MTILRVVIPLTTDSNGLGTALSPRPVIGEILEVTNPSNNWGGTADYTLTRKETGGTVLQVNNAAGPWTYYPRGNVATTSGAVQAGTAIAAVPCDEMLQLVVAQTPALTAGTVHVYYRQD